jgi:Mrp family chromosome partitioning ATPase
MSSEIIRNTVIGNNPGTSLVLSEAVGLESSAKPAQLRPGADWGETLLAAARLKHVLGAGKKLVAVSGFDNQDGAGLLAARIASALAEIDQGKVLLVDANAAASQVAKLFGVRGAPGLLDMLEGQAELKDAVTSSEPANLFVLPLGRASASLATLFGSDRCPLVLRELRAEFRYIIADVGLVRSAEATLFASLSDGVLVSLAAGRRTREEVASFEEELRRLQIPLLGAMLTKRSSG